MAVEFALKKGVRIMNDHIKLRVKFRKFGAIRYIGHLDVMRFFQKCLRRAEIDMCFTTGFSPHQIMSFASPLSVGLESNGEYMDIEVHSITTSADMIERMNASSVPGIQIISVKMLPEDAGNAMASVAAAQYTVKFRPDRIPNTFQAEDETIQKELEKFLTNDVISFTKETKKGTREINLKDGIYELKWLPEQKTLQMLMDASSAGNIKPIQIISAFLSQKGDTLADNALLIVREETFTDIGEEGNRKFVPLDSIGADF